MDLISIAAFFCGLPLFYISLNLFVHCVRYFPGVCCMFILFGAVAAHNNMGFYFLAAILIGTFASLPFVLAKTSDVGLHQSIFLQMQIFGHWYDRFFNLYIVPKVPFICN